MAEENNEKKRIGQDAINNGKLSDSKLTTDKKGNVIDIYDLFQISRDPVIVKLKMLMDIPGSGVTMEEIAENFAESGTFQTNEEAFKSLDEIYNKQLKLVSERPNGIVFINGKIDEEKSNAQALRSGLVGQFDVSNENKLKNIIEKDYEKFYLNYYKTITDSENFKIVDNIISTNIFDSDFLKDAFLNSNIDDLIQDAKNNNLENIAKTFTSLKEELEDYDPKEMEAYEYQLELEKTDKSSPHYREIAEKLGKLLSSTPGLSKKFNQNIIDGNLSEEAKIKNDKYKGTNARILATKMALVVQKDGLENLTENEKKFLVLSLLGGWKTNTNSEFMEMSNNIFEKVCPGYKSDNPELNPEEIIQNFLGYEKKIDPKEFDSIVDASQDKLLTIMKNMNSLGKAKISDKEIAKLMEREGVNLNVNEIVKDYNNSKQNDKEEERYFEGSKLDFTETDGTTFKNIYRDTNVNSWLNTREEALMYRYAVLKKYDETLRENDKKLGDEKYTNSKIYKDKIKQSKKDIEAFEKEIKKYEKKTGKKIETGKSAESKVDKYVNAKIKAKLTKEFIRQENIKSYEDYSKLSKEDKKFYLKNTIAALNLDATSKSDEKQNKLLKKFAQRRLEVLNTDDKSFISINGNNVGTINENAILQEYNSLTSHKFNSFEELENYCEESKITYVNKKLDEYMKEDSFIDLSSTKNPNEKMQKIDQIYDAELYNDIYGKGEDINKNNLPAKIGFFGRLRNSITNIFNRFSNKESKEGIESIENNAPPDNKTGSEPKESNQDARQNTGDFVEKVEVNTKLAVEQSQNSSKQDKAQSNEMKENDVEMDI